jgi:hypothetical protein
MSNFSNNSNLDEIIQEVKQEFKCFLIKRRELILKLGDAFEKVVANPEGICEEIKNVLRDEIAEKLISSRNIELYCHSKWKRKTRPKNEISSFSNQDENHKRIIIDTHGMFVKEEEVASYFETDRNGSSTADNAQRHDAKIVHKEVLKNKQALGISVCLECQELRIKVRDYEEALSHVPFIGADQIIKSDIKCQITKEDHNQLEDAMRKCWHRYYLKFDTLGNLISAEPDVPSAK